MNFLRAELLDLIAVIDLIKMSERDRENILLDIASDEEILSQRDLLDHKFNSEILNYIKDTYIGVKNTYLESKVKILIGENVNIIDKYNSGLIECNCCKYQTIQDRGNYEICPVCFWEDDGSEDISRYSPANRMNLGEAILNFRKFGAISESAKEFVDPAGREKYFQVNG